MPSLHTAQYPATQDPNEFEDMVLAAARIRFGNASLARYGRTGQAQQGVDIYGEDDVGRRVGLQAKNTVGGLTEAVVKAEVAKAESFEPKLEIYVVATAAKRDALLQKVVRELSDERRRQGTFTVTVWFWEDVTSELSKRPSEVQRFFPGFGGNAGGWVEHDRRLFQKLVDELPSDGAIRFLREQPMGFSWPRRKIDPLERFAHEWNTVEREFVREELERGRKDLLAKANAYVGIVTRNTWPVGSNHDLVSVPSEWELEQPERFSKTVATIEVAGDEVVSAYEDLVRLGRRCLSGVSGRGYRVALPSSAAPGAQGRRSEARLRCTPEGIDMSAPSRTLGGVPAACGYPQDLDGSPLGRALPHLRRTTPRRWGSRRRPELTKGSERGGVGYPDFNGRTLHVLSFVMQNGGRATGHR